MVENSGQKEMRNGMKGGEGEEKRKKPDGDSSGECANEFRLNECNTTISISIRKGCCVCFFQSYQSFLSYME